VRAYQVELLKQQAALLIGGSEALACSLSHRGARRVCGTSPRSRRVWRSGMS